MQTTEILQGCTVEGNIIKLPPGQLDRPVYLDVKKALESIGGKWKGGRTQGFVFDHDPAENLSAITSGEKINIKKEIQFFETPQRWADKLVELADIMPSDRILEPSAGRGAIVRAIQRKHPGIDVYGYEIYEPNHQYLLQIPDFLLLGNDFLTEAIMTFDVIIANPPHAKNQDIDHIYKMFSLLRAGGRLVCIASVHWKHSAGKRETSFREWLEARKAVVIPVPAGEFKKSGTMFETCIIVIR